MWRLQVSPHPVVDQYLHWCFLPSRFPLTMHVDDRDEGTLNLCCKCSLLLGASYMKAEPKVSVKLAQSAIVGYDSDSPKFRKISTWPLWRKMLRCEMEWIVIAAPLNTWFNTIHWMISKKGLYFLIALWCTHCDSYRGADRDAISSEDDPFLGFINLPELHLPKEMKCFT